MANINVQGLASSSVIHAAMACVTKRLDSM
jgi:hypothetical protein